MYNSPTYSSANGGYISFNPASTQHAKTSAALPVLTRWTVEVWHYYNATNGAGNPCIVSDIYTYPNINFVLGSHDAGNTVLTGAYYNNGWYTTSTGYSLPSVGWYHIVATFDGSNINLYINNVLTQTTAASTTPSSARIGIYLMKRWDLDGYYDCWGGYLSIVRIYDRALSLSEVGVNYNGSKTRFSLT